MYLIAVACGGALALDAAALVALLLLFCTTD